VPTMRRAKGDPEVDETLEEQKYLKSLEKKKGYRGNGYALKLGISADVKSAKRGKKKGRQKKSKIPTPPVVYLVPTWEGLGIPRLYWPGVKEPVAAIYGVEECWIADVRLPTGGIRTVGPVEIREDCQAKGLEEATVYWGEKQYQIAV
jgi:hypothetical protein